MGLLDAMDCLWCDNHQCRIGCSVGKSKSGKVIGLDNSAFTIAGSWVDTLFLVWTLDKKQALYITTKQTST